MRYFLDTEYDGYGGKLMSLALAPEDGGEEFYVQIAGVEVTTDWVKRNVVPYMDHVEEAHRAPPMSRRDAATALAYYLAHDSAPQIIADWPEDLSHFSMLVLTGPGDMQRMPDFSLHYMNLAGFSTAVHSRVPHNALHDARALREHVLNHLD